MNVDLIRSNYQSYRFVYETLLTIVSHLGSFFMQPIMKPSHSNLDKL